MNGLKSILNQSKLGKYSIVIAATTFLATMSGMWFLRSLSISSNNYIRISEQKTLPSLTLDGHKGWVYEVAISADGKTLASSSYGGKIKVWNLSNGKLLHTINAHTDAIESLVISPDGKIIASGSWDNHIKLWDLTNGNLLQTLKGHIDDVKAIAMTADGHTLASGSYDGVIKIWDLKTGSVKMSIQHLGPITAMAFSPDGQILASGFKKGDIKTWQWDIGKQLHSFAAHTNTIWAIAFSPNGKIIASGGKDGKIRLWQIEKGQLISTLEGHNQAILSVAFSPDGKTIASSGYDRKINLWEVKTEELLETFTAHSKAIWSLEFNPNGQTLVSGSADGSIKLWSLSSLNSKKLQSATLPSVVKKEVDIAVISEITDTDRLEELNQKLYDQIDQSWQQTPTWYEDLVFQMRVNVEGVIVNLEPVNQSARDYVQQTPLLKLLNSSDGEIASHKKSSALFRIVMTPRGALEVSPWSGWENYSSFY